MFVFIGAYHLNNNYVENSHSLTREWSETISSIFFSPDDQEKWKKQTNHPSLNGGSLCCFFFPRE